jgi:hypothetical protein
LSTSRSLTPSKLPVPASPSAVAAESPRPRRVSILAGDGKRAASPKVSPKSFKTGSVPPSVKKSAMKKMVEVPVIKASPRVNVGGSDPVGVKQNTPVKMKSSRLSMAGTGNDLTPVKNTTPAKSMSSLKDSSKGIMDSIKITRKRSLSMGPKSPIVVETVEAQGTPEKIASPHGIIRLLIL